MRKNALIFSALAAVCLPALLWAIPQQIGGFNNNIMEEDKWDQLPDYDEWRLDGDGRDGRAPAAGDPEPKLFVNTKPVEFFGIAAPAGAAKLTADERRWISVEMRLPKRESDDFHLLLSTLSAEMGKEMAVTGEKPERSVSASVKKFKVGIREVSTGGLDVTIARADSATASAVR